MGPRAERARGGRDEEGRRGAASKDVPRDPPHLPVDFLAERMLADPVTCGDTARSALHGFLSGVPNSAVQEDAQIVQPHQDECRGGKGPFFQRLQRRRLTSPDYVPHASQPVNDRKEKGAVCLKRGYSGTFDNQSPLPDLLARRRLKRCPSRWLCLSAAWSFVRVFSEPDGFTVIFGRLRNNSGGTMHWNDTRPAHFGILKVVLKEALAECLMDSYSLDVHAG
nr:uncharacterized protein LOC119624861 [Chlorocebus sabaeus]XP_037856077.1 uncharacterized protein LOC119624861 [Chlorocebus sabaeus]XP_037856078.1 uncharacterized protein LOC119624861 [Chlorocebus sabaeus]XP_037856079.1 uncharacterized protein LOC119624861 [Chlorocebus sabaeus]XP_037856080.1 uncharacterized protein LOC119624861 [Chlorocebus sabaeus]XP_037856081.1 uncharacterized protein LOC119624861 [Chlorocebus sabaeus]XP_037856082.1 uncharacterized protein LOC119624861 [Chlorocebus sabaeu